MKKTEIEKPETNSTSKQEVVKKVVKKKRLQAVKPAVKPIHSAKVVVKENTPKKIYNTHDSEEGKQITKESEPEKAEPKIPFRKRLAIKARRFVDSEKVKDFTNPHSEFRGAGRLLQLTNTDKYAKRFINRFGGGSNYSDLEFSSNPKKDKLKRWFSEKWVDVKTGEACGRSSAKHSDRDYPACRPSKRINSDTPKTSSELSEEEKSKFTEVKTSRNRIPYTHKKEIEKKRKTSYNKNIPLDKELYDSVVNEAKSKFDRWPSAYGSGWVVMTYKKRGGKYKTVSDENYSLSDLEKDYLITKGFLPEINIIENKDSLYSKEDIITSIIVIEDFKSKVTETSYSEPFLDSWKLFIESFD